MTRTLRRRYGHTTGASEVRLALNGYLHHVRGTKAAYRPPASLTRHVERALSQDLAEQKKALRGIVHHDAGTREEYQLPRSLMRQVAKALEVS
jgi:hypothetical protein